MQKRSFNSFSIRIRLISSHTQVITIVIISLLWMSLLLLYFPAHRQKDIGIEKKEEMNDDRLQSLLNYAES